jgi:hypothetical protein
MNGIARILRRIGPLAAAAGLAAPLCACVDIPSDQTPQAAIAQAATPTNTAVDPKSAAAKEIARIESEPSSYPRFQDIPAVPADVRPSAAWKASVLSLQSAGAAIVSASGPDSFSLNNTEAFAADVRRQLDSKASTPPTAAEVAESAAFVKAARARATPPPRPH